MWYLDEETITILRISAVIMGLVFGSFLNVVIYRIPRHESIVFPPSHCPACNENIKWYDNIPVLSYIILRGRCRNCKARISVRYPIIEALNGLLWLLNLYYSKDPLQCLFGFAFISLLIVISAVDLDRMEIPDVFNCIIFGLAVVKLIIVLLLNRGSLYPLADFGLGALSGSLLLFGLYYLLLKLTEKEGLGGGDVKLALAAGAFLGWKQVLFGIGVSAYIGLIVILISAAITKKSLKKAFPFGPFLSAGFLISYLYFDNIFEWYINKFF